MQFREQGKKIQCIRSTYDPATKRSHQAVIASFDRWADKLPSDELEGLTDAERQELAGWFASHRAQKIGRLNAYKARTGGETLTDLADAIRSAGTLTDEQAAALWCGLDAVAKALKKAGHPRPKRSDSAPAPEVHPGQVELLPSAAVPSDLGDL